MRREPPYAEDLLLDVPIERAPAVTIDAGLAAAYAAITGDALPLTLSDPLSAAVTGGTERLANPGLVLTVAIGQSTVATRRVIANLLYRDVALRRPVRLGETLTTTVTPIAVEPTRSGSGRAKVLLDIVVDSVGADTVAHFQRLALLPVSDPARLAERPIPEAGAGRPLGSYLDVVPAWNAAALGSRFDGAPGDEWTDPLCDTVSSARELVRLSANVAAAHRDERAGSGGRRLVYGGHTIALAQASLARTVPGMLTLLAWRSCDHLAPVFEDDLIETSTRVEGLEPAGGGLALLDVSVRADALRGAERVPVLAWNPILLVAQEAAE